MLPGVSRMDGEFTMKKCQPRRKQLSLECFEHRLCLTIPTFTAYTIDEGLGGLGGATDVELADIDRDGDLDIVVASFDDDEVSWYETLNGSGEFGEPILVTRDADGAIAVATGDFDGDGDLDLVSSSYLDGRIAWYENTNGDGRFGDPKLIAKGEEGKLGFVPDENHDFSASLAAADVDGDGDVDVLSGSFRDYIFTWYENDGGEFSEHHSTQGEATAIRVADLDGDGDLDVLGSSVFAVAWYENGGAGLFSAEHILSTELGTAVGDMDGDGDLDVAYDTLDDGYVWRENLGDDAPFGSPQPIHCSCDGSPTTIIDLNADGIAEIVNESSVFENSNGMWEEHWLGGQNDFSSVSAFGDVDGDGDTDLVKLTDLTRFGSENSHELQWYSSSLTDVTVHDLPINSRVRGLVDLDSDGDLDFLGGTEWLENDRESGSFESHPLAIEAGGVMVDLDGDDDLDVLLYSTNDDPTIRWQENVDGAGNFSDALPAGTGLGRLLGLGDLDSDGDLDILSSANEEIAWHKNVGETGVFDVRRVIAKVPGSMRLSLGDLDGDGDVDLLVSSWTDDEVSHALIDQETFWLENLGNAESFSEKQVIATDVDSVVDVDIADMDGDGDLDVLAGEYKRGISWYDNLNGKGSFGEKKVIGELLPYEGVYSIERP